MPTAAERIARLPAADRREIVAQAIAAAASVPMAYLHPLAEDLYRDGVNSSNAVEALTGKVNAGGYAFSTQDLRSATGQAINLMIDAAIHRQPTPEHRIACKPMSLPNFKPTDVPMVSGGADVFRISEAGEARTSGVFLDGQTAQINTVAAIAGVTRDVIINAQWDVVAMLATELHNAALAKEREAFVNLIGANPILADDGAMFSAARGNDLGSIILGSDELLKTEWLARLTATLRDLRDITGHYLTPAPAVILVPSKYEIVARALTVVMPWLSVFSDPRLKHVVLLPAPDARPVIGLAMLGKATMPTVDMAPPDFQRGIWRIRVWHDFAIVPLSWHGVRAGIDETTPP